MQHERNPFVDNAAYEEPVARRSAPYGEGSEDPNALLDEYSRAMFTRDGQLYWNHGERVTDEDIEKIERATSPSLRDEWSPYDRADASRSKMHIAIMHGDEKLATVADIDETDFRGFVMHVVNNRMINDERLAQARLNPPHLQPRYSRPLIDDRPAPRIPKEHADTTPRAEVVRPDSARRGDTAEMVVLPSGKSTVPSEVVQGATVQADQSNLIDDLPGRHSFPKEESRSRRQSAATRTHEKHGRAKGIAKKTAGAILLSHVLYAIPSYTPVIGWDEHILARAIVDGDFKAGVETIQAVTSHVPIIGNIVK